MNSEYTVAAALAALVGITELITRYRDAPSTLLLVPSAWFYALVNAAGGMAALLAIYVFGWTFGGDTPQAVTAYRVLVAGFGSAALFRSSLFLVKVGGRDVGVGPSLILSGLLEAADRGVDRVRARRRAAHVSQIMGDVSFKKAQDALPIHCLALLQNAAPVEQLAMSNSVERLRAARMPDEQKSLALGLAIMNIGGPGVLAAAVTALGDGIKRDSPPSQEELSQAEAGWARARKLAGSAVTSEPAKETPAANKAAPRAAAVSGQTAEAHPQQVDQGQPS